MLNSFYMFILFYCSLVNTEAFAQNMFLNVVYKEILHLRKFLGPLKIGSFAGKYGSLYTARRQTQFFFFLFKMLC